MESHVGAGAVDVGRGIGDAASSQEGRHHAVLDPTNRMLIRDVDGRAVRRDHDALGSLEGRHRQGIAIDGPAGAPSREQGHGEPVRRDLEDPPYQAAVFMGRDVEVAGRVTGDRPQAGVLQFGNRRGVGPGFNSSQPAGRDPVDRLAARDVEAPLIVTGHAAVKSRARKRRDGRPGAGVRIDPHHLGLIGHPHVKEAVPTEGHADDHLRRLEIRDQRDHGSVRANLEELRDGGHGMAAHREVQGAVIGLHEGPRIPEGRRGEGSGRPHVGARAELHGQIQVLRRERPIVSDPPLHAAFLQDVPLRVQGLGLERVSGVGTQAPEIDRPGEGGRVQHERLADRNLGIAADLLQQREAHLRGFPRRPFESDVSPSRRLEGLVLQVQRHVRPRQHREVRERHVRAHALRILRDQPVLGIEGPDPEAVRAVGGQVLQDDPRDAVRSLDDLLELVRAPLARRAARLTQRAVIPLPDLEHGDDLQLLDVLRAVDRDDVRRVLDDARAPDF
ncbi:hypothetical protein D3C86_1127490 [compost metagenome]